jgi:hypothetical protein
MDAGFQIARERILSYHNNTAWWVGPAVSLLASQFQFCRSLIYIDVLYEVVKVKAKVVLVLN